LPPALVPGAALVFILAGLFARLQPDLSGWSRSVWMAGLVLTGLPVAFRTLAGLFRGRAAADIVAMLAILAAVPLGEPLAGLVVVLMQTGGEALERYAEGRAARPSALGGVRSHVALRLGADAPSGHRRGARGRPAAGRPGK
jgi:cation transport ATPase